MQYRLHINQAEYLGGLLPMIDAIARMTRHHAHRMHTPGWQLLLDFAIFLIVTLLLGLQHFTSYVELTPSSLEYRALWRHRSILYSQMKRIVRVSRIAEIYADEMKKLSFRLDKPQEFFTEFRQYAPHALREGDAQ